MSEKTFDVVIIGGGIVGVASAYKIQSRFPHLRVAILEKETSLATHQTGRNSGVIHSGLYYKPGSFKAENCKNGRHQLVAFAQENKIPHEVCGKVVVATNESELPFLKQIFGNGVANNIEGIRKITGDQIREIEPHCAGIAGIHVPCTGIIDFNQVANKLGDLVIKLNPLSEVLLGHRVEALERGVVNRIKTNRGVVNGKYLVFCAGLHSDRLAKKDQLDLDTQVVGFRGDYYELTEKAKRKVKNLIYPVPNPAFPFLGVHFTRMVNGEIECGPNAVFSFKREGYRKTDFSWRDTREALGFRGTWKFFAKHWRFGLDEYKRAFSKKLFLDRLRVLIPSLEIDDIRPARAGVRAMALEKSGSMVDDFKIEYLDDSIHVLNAPSPAATACLSIADRVCDLAKKHFSL